MQSQTAGYKEGFPKSEKQDEPQSVLFRYAMYGTIMDATKAKIMTTTSTNAIARVFLFMLAPFLL